jgi:hypothetical protein
MVFKVLTKLFLLLILLENLSFAAKVKSSESYINNFEKDIQPFVNSLDQLKSLLETHHKSGSFITTDIWGLKPNWYIKGENIDLITTEYPYSEQWLNQRGIWKKFSNNLTRNIGGVILKPITYRSYSNNEPKLFREHLNINFNFSPGYMDTSYYKKYLKNYFASNGLDLVQSQEALKTFEKKIEPILNIIENQIFNRFDSLYKDIAIIGDVSVYDNIAKKLDKKNKLSNDFLIPSKHNSIFTEELFKTYKTDLNVVSRKKLHEQYQKRIKKQDLFNYYMRDFPLQIEIPVYYFEVAKGMSKNDKYNQLLNLKNILEKNVAENKATKSTNKNYTIYSDKIYNTYKGSFAIDFESGIGYWTQPIYNSHQDIITIFKKLEKEKKIIDKAIENYYSIVLKEIIGKNSNYESQNTTTF